MTRYLDFLALALIIKDHAYLIFYSNDLTTRNHRKIAMTSINGFKKAGLGVGVKNVK
jgi:hypothetical protein